MKIINKTQSARIFNRNVDFRVFPRQLKSNMRPAHIKFCTNELWNPSIESGLKPKLERVFMTTGKDERRLHGCLINTEL